MTHFLKLLAFSLLVLTFSNCQNPSRNAFDEGIEQALESHQIPGMAIGIVLNDSLVWSKGYGYANIEKELPFTPQTIINIASTSKTILGTCIMHAVENNQLSLDEPINNYLPFKIMNPHTGEDHFTLKHLATHTSGIIDDNDFYYSEENYHNGGDPPVQLGDFLKSYLTPSGKNYHQDNFSHDHIGETFHYSNIGAALAGYVFEAKLGTPLNEYAAKYIFEPLQMNHTGYFFSDIDITKHAKLYNDSLQEIELYSLVTFPDGCLRTNVADLSHFLISMMNDGIFKGKRILNESSVATMLNPYFKNDSIIKNFNPLHCNHGLFWLHLGESTPNAKVGHAGGDDGVRVYMYFDPETKTGVIILINKLIHLWDDKIYSELVESTWEYANKFRKE